MGGTAVVDPGRVIDGEDARDNDGADIADRTTRNKMTRTLQTLKNKPKQSNDHPNLPDASKARKREPNGVRRAGATNVVLDSLLAVAVSEKNPKNAEQNITTMYCNHQKNSRKVHQVQPERATDAK